MFHVSIWNSSPSGHPRCSIGDISKKDDRTGESFVDMFGPIEDMEDEKTSEEITFPTAKLAAKRSAERRRHERDTEASCRDSVRHVESLETRQSVSTSFPKRCIVWTLEQWPAMT